MRQASNVFLVGPMGAGKTTIGKLLADRLRLEFVDSDKEIEDVTGADIPWIFDVEGEEGFRRRETRVIDDLTQRSGILLATGGGAVLKSANRNYLAGRGFVVYLFATVDQQVARTAKDRNRPLLQQSDPRQVLSDLFAVRDPLYREIADLVVTTDNRHPSAVARDIFEQITLNLGTL